MNILVCVKPVPNPEKYADIKIDPSTKRLIREGVPSIINPADRNALEEALLLREQQGGKVTVLSMAPETAADRMTECLAMGADEAFILSDKTFAGADTFGTSKTLAKAASLIGDFDLILFGNESADGATAHVPVQVAEWLGLPHLSRISSIEAENEAFIVSRKGDSGKQRFRIKMPCVLAVNSDINKPRFVNAMGLIKAKKKPLNVWNCADLGLDPQEVGIGGSPTKAGALLAPDMNRSGESLGTDAETIAERIARFIGKTGA